MRKYDFDIKKSNKAYIDALEHYIVVHDGIVYLRIVGQEGDYSVMTATSGEDEGGISAYVNQEDLNSIAVVVAESIDCNSTLKYDFHNRPYINICQCEFISDAYRVAAAIFEKLTPSQTTSNFSSRRP